jgi:hypothetical protein
MSECPKVLKGFAEDKPISITNSCQRFNHWLKSAKPGTYLFSGNLLSCEPVTDGLDILVTELSCENKNRILNHVYIAPADKSTGKFDIIPKTECF